MELEHWNTEPLIPTPSILYWAVVLNLLRNDDSLIINKQFYKQVFKSQLKGGLTSYV